MSEYTDFLARKAIIHVPSGLKKSPKIHPKLFPFQSDLTKWSLKRGRAGLFLSTGLGKTIQQLEFARHVENHTKRPILIFAPLSVGGQTQQEAINHLELETKIISDDSEVGDRGIYIINYAKLHKIDPDKFSGVVLDEASILKGFDRSTASRLIEMFQKTPFRLVCTATPAPNDTMEIGAYSEFLGVMPMTEMLATFFVHDAGETQKWRLKGHAEQDYWKWMASWCACVSKPSDLGYENGGYDLPPLKVKEIIVESNMIGDGELFAFQANTLDERRHARKGSINERVEAAAKLANGNDLQWIVWCNLNDESKAITKSIEGAVEITGSDTDEHKEKVLADFLSGKVRVIVTKPVLFGYGLNLQRCFNTIFCGLSDSWEQYHQAVRRFWRFGQTNQVNVYIIISSSEGSVLQNINRKEKLASEMQRNLVSHMAEITKKEIHGITRTKLEYNPTQKMKLPTWL